MTRLLAATTGSTLLGMAVFGLSLLVPGSAAAAADGPPNIVVILTDDQGWGDLSLHGNANLSTPHIDSIAKQGAEFDRFFVSPVCSPTRAEFLTGRYHPRGGVYDTSTGGERLDLDEQTIAEVFRDAGYATGAFGKWHSGMQYPYNPRGRGFQEYYGFCSGHWGNYFSPELEHNGKLVRGDGYITDDFTNHAIEFIEANKQQPFFCYMPLCTPHSPMQVPDSFYEKFKDADLAMRNRDPEREDLLHTRAALAMCENIDWNVGRILEKLDELQIADDTIVIYFSDNGPNGFRWNGGMKGRKGSTDEGGMRVPCLVRWPGRIPAGSRIESIGGAIDLLPTLADLAGIALKPKHPLDGVSLRPLLEQTAQSWPDRMLFSHWNNRVSVRTDRFRLDNAGKLFDMHNDPEQRHNVASEHPETAAELVAAAERWRAELLPGLRDDDRPFPVGYREFPITHLPARDGVGHGNIVRSARAPNCSFFTGWTSVEDRITWDVDVHTAGTYTVEVHYTCEADDVGAKLELSFADAALEAQVKEPHDPPLRGAEHDRASRGAESFVKDFRPLSLGQVELPAGRGALTLRATEIPGDEVIDVRRLVLTLQP
ncbi:arylsulfatase [Candidatus Laterigemmans baculatus]|uniref:arylsulfatase n=1 Tax=Candidatus Laterigemmans baculatus TaxID=2770505 RepID=UPI00193C171E|nr:arylsulfatase [Candidatus Laterigemmans baculatus]